MLKMIEKEYKELQHKEEKAAAWIKQEILKLSQAMIDKLGEVK